MAAQLFVPALYPHQETVRVHPSPRKLWRAGRRAAKTTGAFHMAVLGHGAPENQLQPHKGLVHGFDVLWVTKDYPLAAILWQTEIAPRFRGVDGVKLNESEHTVTLPNSARLWLRSAEAIQGVRGIGKNLGGCVCSEAAHWDLKTALQDVIIPALLDNQGWLLCESTTSAGSYFNTLATEIRASKRLDWVEFYHTALDNPRITETAFRAMEAEYPPGSPQCQQEVFAELVTGGSGLAFPEWDPSVHLVRSFQLPNHWRVAAGMDWGIRAPSVVLLCASDQEQNVVVFKEFMWREKSAYDAGYDFASELLLAAVRWPEFITCDSAMDDGSSKVGGQTILSEFQRGCNDALAGLNAPAMIVIPAPKGPGSRSIGYNLVKKMLAWGPKLDDGTLPITRQPMLRIVADECPYLTRTLPVLRRAPLPLADKSGVIQDGKVKDDVDENQPDTHAFDSLRYYLQGLIPTADAPTRYIPVDIHPGFLPTGQRRNRERSPATEKAEALVVAEWNAQQSGKGLGGKFGRSARRMARE